MYDSGICFVMFKRCETMEVKLITFEVF